MATSAMPMPGQMPMGQPQASPAGADADPLQVALGKLLEVISTLAQQNPIVNTELMEMRAAGIKALQKTMLAAQPQPQATQPPASADNTGA